MRGFCNRHSGTHQRKKRKTEDFEKPLPTASTGSRLPWGSVMGGGKKKGTGSHLPRIAHREDWKNLRPNMAPYTRGILGAVLDLQVLFNAPTTGCTAGPDRTPSTKNKTRLVHTGGGGSRKASFVFKTGGRAVARRKKSAMKAQATRTRRSR